MQNLKLVPLNVEITENSYISSGFSLSGAIEGSTGPIKEIAACLVSCEQIKPFTRWIEQLTKISSSEERGKLIDSFIDYFLSGLGDPEKGQYLSVLLGLSKSLLSKPKDFWGNLFRNEVHQVPEIKLGLAHFIVFVVRQYASLSEDKQKLLLYALLNNKENFLSNALFKCRNIANRDYSECSPCEKILVEGYLSLTNEGSLGVGTNDTVSVQNYDDFQHYPEFIGQIVPKQEILAQKLFFKLYSAYGGAPEQEIPEDLPSNIHPWITLLGSLSECFTESLLKDHSLIGARSGQAHIRLQKVCT